LPLGSANIGANDKYSSLCNWASAYYLNFTHFTKLKMSLPQNGKSRLRTETLAKLWVRQAAVIGISSQAGWDAFIPIYKSSLQRALDDVFDPCKLSYVAIRVKNRVTDVAATRYLGSDRFQMDAVDAPMHGVSDAGSPGAERTPTATTWQDDTCLELLFDIRSPIAAPVYELLPQGGKNAKV
jgi:hypothetical protein